MKSLVSPEPERKEYACLLEDVTDLGKDPMLDHLDEGI
jgi:hypothetical protein